MYTLWTILSVSVSICGSAMCRTSIQQTELNGWSDWSATRVLDPTLMEVRPFPMPSVSAVDFYHHILHALTISCQSWGQGQTPGAFKRVMTVRAVVVPSSTHLCCTPSHTILASSLICAPCRYSLHMRLVWWQLSIVKDIRRSLALGVSARGFDYQSCEIDRRLPPVIPTPYILWSAASQSLLLKCYMCFSVAWGLEMSVPPSFMPPSLWN